MMPHYNTDFARSHAPERSAKLHVKGVQVSVMVQYVKPTAQVYFLVKPWMGGLGRMLSLQGSDITRAYKKSFRSLLAGVMQNAISTLLKWTLEGNHIKEQ